MRKSFKTSLIGFGFGLIPLANAVLQALANHQAVDYHQVLIGAGFIALGVAAKDSDVTGGTRAQ
jgi:hypothetical protein